MKKISVILAIFACFFVISTGNAGIFGDDNIMKAGKIAQTGNNFSAAHNLINEQLLDEPDNASNYFRASRIYFAMNMTSQMDWCLTQTIRLDHKKYHKKVAKFYEDRGFNFAHIRRVQKAIQCFTTAHKLDPSLRTKDINDLIVYGKDYLQKGHNGKAKSSFDTAYALDSSTGDQISDIYMDFSKNYSEQDNTLCLNFLSLAKSFSEKHTPAIVQSLHALYESSNASNGDKTKIKNALRQYLGSTEFKQMFPPPPPNLIIRERGLREIPVGKGETTQYWIVIETGKKGNFNFVSKKWKFILTFHDGEISKAWLIDKWPTKKLIKFKITNLSDEPIILKTS